MTDHHDGTHGRVRSVKRGAIGIIAVEDKLLMIRRASGIPKGGYWCFPGGHLEPGETSRRAIQRELAEELGIDAVPTERLGSVRTSDAKYVLAVWRIRYAGGSLNIAEQEVAEVAWFTPAQIRAMTPNLQSNLMVLDMLDTQEREGEQEEWRMANGK